MEDTINMLSVEKKNLLSFLKEVVRQKDKAGVEKETVIKVVLTQNQLNEINEQRQWFRFNGWLEKVNPPHPDIFPGKDTRRWGRMIHFVIE